MSTTARLHGGSVLLVYAALASPLLRLWLESSMLGHMLVQIPLLIVVGILAAPLIPRRVRAWLHTRNAYGIPLTLLALFAASYWMLPRALDAALNSAVIELAKFITLPLLVGVPFALSWRRLSLVGQGFVWSNVVSMMGVLGWLYLVAPVRICNNYLVDQQVVLGQGMLAFALALFAVGGLRVLVGNGVQSMRPAASSAAQMNS